MTARIVGAPFSARRALRFAALVLAVGGVSGLAPHGFAATIAQAPSQHVEAGAGANAASAAGASEPGPLAAAGVASVPAARRLPTYATRMPPSVHWVYLLRRGFLSGRGDLRWSVRDGHYEARLEGRVAGFSVLDWTSRGAVSAAGPAPERFIIRRGKEVQAAIFQSQAGKITYTGPAAE